MRAKTKLLSPRVNITKSGFDEKFSVMSLCFLQIPDSCFHEMKKTQKQYFCVFEERVKATGCFKKEAEEKNNVVSVASKGV